MGWQELIVQLAIQILRNRVANRGKTDAQISVENDATIDAELDEIVRLRAEIRGGGPAG